MRHRWTWPAAAVVCLMAAACVNPDLEVPSESELFEAEIRFLEEFRRLRQKPAFDSNKIFGQDPFRIEEIPGTRHLLVLLRGTSEILVLTPELDELSRYTAPKEPTGWDLSGDGRLFVVGAGSNELMIYQIDGVRLKLADRIEVSSAVAARDVAFVETADCVYLVDSFDRNLIRLDLNDLEGGQEVFDLGAGPTQIEHVEGHLVVNLLLEHTLLVLPLPDGRPDFENSSRISREGPFWAFAATVRDGRLMIAAGGIENAPLNRQGGEFGNIDSFLYIFALERDTFGRFRLPEDSVREACFNLSMIGVVTPKVLRFRDDPWGQPRLWLAGFGSGRLAVFELNGVEPRLVSTPESIPGVTDLVILDQEGEDGKRIGIVSSLLDRVEYVQGDSGNRSFLWPPVMWQGTFEPKTGSAGGSSLFPNARLGELLFFTTLMTPRNRSIGQLSRFTCEACHFEGNGDGRVHYSGRERIFATTKTVRGLRNNVPLFTRGGDENIAAMVISEFRVANQDRRDRFALSRAEHPWLTDPEGASKGTHGGFVSATRLREALTAFFIVFDHSDHPLNGGNRVPSSQVLQGLSVFRERCAECHQAIASTRTAEAQPFGAWRERAFGSDSDLVWGARFFSRTGIKPYLDPAGARVPSLRRVWTKYPLFTDGSGSSAREVLEAFRYSAGGRSWHRLDPVVERASEGIPLTQDEVDALELLLRHF